MTGDIIGVPRETGKSIGGYNFEMSISAPFWKMLLIIEIIIIWSN
jgi:hypothetical protein